MALVVHGTHHKMGTTWFNVIFREICKEFGWNYHAAHKGLPPEGTDIYFNGKSRIPFDELPDYRGSHMIRDPRDQIISAYHYHYAGKEKWVHTPLEQYGGKSYYEALQAVGKEEGLMLEVERTIPLYMQLRAWDFDNPKMLEIKYEDFIDPSQQADRFATLFKHYGWSDEHIARGVRIALENSFSSQTGRKLGEVKDGEHRRSGMPGQWETEFTPAVHAKYQETLGDIHKQLGY